ncbi:MAG TPA: SUMF1/EgtB/PvdO family nonheme iron enzyme [Candidatus Hydrogenedentes bacterium]|nr:SUMF1/EgtB/PvdO family nonheme iron enzyme [Candidatus Hydrogenedentota bacterium]
MNYPQSNILRVGAFLACIACAAVALAGEGAPLYAKRDTWPETMTAARAAFQAAGDNAAYDAGPWYTTGALKADGFAQALFPEQGVDLQARTADDKRVWVAQPGWKDGAVINLPGGDSHSTYLFRTITAAAPMQLMAFFGSDDGLEVWFNGEKVISNDVPRVAAPNQDKAALSFKQGENKVLMKIFNRSGGHAFYFAVTDERLDTIWRQITADFPLQTQWFEQSAGGDGPLYWFRTAGDMATEERIVNDAFDRLGDLASGLKNEAARLKEEQAAANDPRWLALFERARLAAGNAELLNRVNFEALQRAVADLTAAYPGEYADGEALVKRVAEMDAVAGKARQAILDAQPGAEAALGETAAQATALQREALLANPLLHFERLLLVKRGEGNMGLPQNWQGNCAVARAGYDNEICVMNPVSPDSALTTFFKPEGPVFVGDVDLHFDASKMLISMPGSQDRWQIWEIRADGSGLRQVTPGDQPDVDNYDACYLPDGRIIFASTRCFQGIPCVGGADAVANFCIMNPDGTGIRMLCFDQDHNWCPTVLNNGRVLFSRWEYSDTPHYFSRLLFNMNPDGTNQMEYYGSNSFWPNSIFYARPIPGHPTKIIAIVSGHHGVARMGELVVFDPAAGRHEADGALQRIPGYGKRVEPIIVDQLVNDSWPKFLHPYPLSDKYFLVSCKPAPDALWGIYLVDIFDNMVLLKEEPGYALLEPVPFRATPTPPAIPDKVRLDSKDATVYLADIYQGDGLKDIPRGTVKTLRLFAMHYTYPKMGGHMHIGVEGPWDVHRILGTVPVFDDGSAVFTVPANTPIAVQPLDDRGRALQVMRSWFTAMPGEILSCVGCHEKQNMGPPVTRTLASRTRPAAIEPWYGPARGFSFKRDVQPALDQFCVGCHNGQEGRPDFARKDQNGWNNFTPSYLALHPYVRRPGPESDYHLATPMEWHADTSELIQMLEKGHHGVKLDDEAWDRLYTWIDLNVPDHGTWHEHRPIPGEFDKRRAAMLAAYANRTEDLEAIPEGLGAPREFMAPEPPVMQQSAAVPVDGWPFSNEDAQALQRAAAGAVAAADGPSEPQRRTVDLGNGLTMDFVLIPAGEYVMGSAAGAIDEQPPSAVTIGQPFWMSVTEVSNSQYACFNPAHDTGTIDQHNKDHTRPGYPANLPEQPVARVSWDEAMAFCEWLTGRAGAPCTLPTEAQWEWACRAGADTPFFYGGMDADFSGFANLADLSVKLLAVAGIDPQPIANPSPYEDFLPKDARFDDGERIVTGVGKYQPNPWGLLDMHGNVAEWTRTSFAAYPYAEDARNDPISRDDKVVRGGSWLDRPYRATASFRLRYKPYQKVFNVGFRVLMSVDGTNPVNIARN